MKADGVKANGVQLNAATSQLLAALFDGAGAGHAAALLPTFALWMAASKPFVHFAQENQLKIRKKIRTLRNDEERDDLACELRTAYLLLQERKFAVTYEPGGKAAGRSADFAVTFRTHTQFHVEVTRLRLPERALVLSPDEVARVEGQRLANAVCEKLGQFNATTPNVLWVWSATPTVLGVAVDEVMAALKRRAEQSEPEFFARYGFAKRADFIRQLQRLNAIIVQGMDATGEPTTARWWANNDTRHALPSAVAQRLRALVMVA